MTELTVADIMSKDVLAVSSNTSIETAARLLAKRHIGGAPVIEDGGRPVGVVSLTDLVDPDRAAGLTSGYPHYYMLSAGTVTEFGENSDVTAKSGQVHDVMSPFVLSIESTATLIETANRMLAESVHRLLVMTGNRLVGIVTSTDLLRGFVMQHGNPA